MDNVARRRALQAGAIGGAGLDGFPHGTSIGPRLSALETLEEIAAVPGIDGIFIGPADLAASLGHLGNPCHPDVGEAIVSAIRRIRAAGKPAGFLSPNQEMLENVVEAGCVFTAVDIDPSLLRRAALERLDACKGFKG